jgi:predicted TPR repeat methyltransferase
VFAIFRHNDPELIRIETLVRDDQLAEAATALTRLGEQAPQDPRVYAVGAMLGFAAKNPAAALKSADIALGLAPGWPRALLHRARALEALNRLPEALVACKAVIDADIKQYAAIDLAVAVGRRLGSMDIPEQLLRRAQASDPKNVSVWLALGRFLSRHKQDEAMTWLNRVLDAQPDNIDALTTLSSLHIAAGNTEGAEQLIARAQRIDPDNEAVRFQAARVRGDGSTQIPANLVRNLFDEYAERFDQSLVGGLGYRLPRIVAEKVRTLYPDLNINLLDLGCGTGLLGAALGRIRGYFVGVDLSEKMLQQATKHGVYSRLHVAEIVEALTATDAEEYEVITANDVVVYVAELTPFVEQSHRVLRKGGTLIFSCELALPDEPPVVLRPSQRYAHRIDVVRAICEASGFAEVQIEEMVVRMDHAVPIQSFLVTATKSAS